MNIFRTLWLSLKDLFEDLFVLMVVNVLWVLINAPVGLAMALSVAANAGSSLLIALLLLGVLTIGPANAGLYTIAQRVAEGRTSSWRDFIAGLRAHAQLSWKVYGLWMFGFIIIIVNLQFYNQMANTLGSFLTILFLYFALIWIALLIYIGPLMILQNDKRIKTIARNASLMALGRPVFTLITLILMVVIVVLSALSTILPFVVTFAFLAIWGFRATLTLIAEAEARRLAAQEKAAQQQISAEKGRGGQIRPRD
jgi:uncharacterized membrane protein YesL